MFVESLSSGIGCSLDGYCELAETWNLVESKAGSKQIQGFGDFNDKGMFLYGMTFPLVRWRLWQVHQWGHCSAVMCLQMALRPSVSLFNTSTQTRTEALLKTCQQKQFKIRLFERHGSALIWDWLGWGWMLAQSLYLPFIAALSSELIWSVPSFMGLRGLWFMGERIAT